MITGSGAFKDVPRSIFGFARDDSDENGGRVMTQVKNSLGRDDLPSLSYVIESVDVPTKKGIAKTGKFVFTGESERSVSDVIRDSRGGPEEHDERKEASAWLVDYLTDNTGEMSANDVFKAGAAAGYTRDILKRAKGKKIRSAKVGGSWVWQLVEFAPDLQGSSKGAREQGTEALPRSLACSLAPFNCRATAGQAALPHLPACARAHRHRRVRLLLSKDQGQPRRNSSMINHDRIGRGDITPKPSGSRPRRSSTCTSTTRAMTGSRLKITDPRLGPVLVALAPEGAAHVATHLAGTLNNLPRLRPNGSPPTAVGCDPHETVHRMRRAERAVALRRPSTQANEQGAAEGSRPHQHDAVETAVGEGA